MLETRLRFALFRGLVSKLTIRQDNPMDVQQILDEARKSGRRFLDEVSAKRVVGSFGIAVPRGVILRDSAELRSAPFGVTFPVAAKLVSPDASHKSDVGGVRLGIATPEALEVAFDALHRIARQHDFRF